MSQFLKRFFSREQEQFLLNEYSAELSFRYAQFDEKIGERLTQIPLKEEVGEQYLQFLQKLSGLKESKLFTLNEEIELLKDYVSLYKLAFPEVFVEETYTVETEDLKIPALITLSIVQNVFHHGYNTMPDFPVKIKVTNIRKRVLIDVVNKVNPRLTDQKNTEIMQCLEPRLYNHFEENYTLIINGNSNTYRTHLSLNLES